MKMKSRIKSLFSPLMLERIAAICDTNTIQNNQRKMDLLQRLLNRDGIRTGVLGGATNRYVVTIDGYAVKFAVDDQGYKDNLMEYSLTQSMPYTRDSYETNGYILVQQIGRPLSLEEWQLRKYEIRRILDEIGADYLLGDVGYYDRNITNWVIGDDNELSICDYAYCHRRTEELFTCPRCGSIMAYDENSIYVLCTDRANCHSKFSYNDIKTIQGDKVDWEMIHNSLDASVKIPNGQDFVEIDIKAEQAIGERTMYVRSYRDLYIYNKLKEESEMVQIDYSDPNITTMLRELLVARATGNSTRVNEIEEALHDLEKPLGVQVECVIDPEFQEIMDRDKLANEEAMIYERSGQSQPPSDLDTCYSLNDLISMACTKTCTNDEPEEEIAHTNDEPEKEETSSDGEGEEPYYYDEEDMINIQSKDNKPLTNEVKINGASVRDIINEGLEG